MLTVHDTYHDTIYDMKKNPIHDTYPDLKILVKSCWILNLCIVCCAGIYSVNADFNQQKVTVWGICNKYDVLATIRSKRKEACFWNPEDTEEILEQSKPKPPSPSPCPPKRSMSFALSKARTLCWKLTLKKVFMRSNSF